MYFLIPGNDIYRLDLTRQRINISIIANVAKIRMRSNRDQSPLFIN